MARIDFHRLTQRAGEGLEEGFGDVVRLITVLELEVQITTERIGEALEELADERDVEVLHHVVGDLDDC